MPRRHILTERQRSTLFDLPTDEDSLLKHYTLDDDDLDHIRERRRPENRLGFALQLCALRYPGRILYPRELIPKEVLSFIGAQIGIKEDALLSYATRRQTRQKHMDALRVIYGYKTFSGRGACDLKVWLDKQAEDARSNEDMALRFIEECRLTQTILPAISTIERLCADALVAAERRIEARIANRLDENMRERLDRLLTDMADDRLTRFIWLRRFEVGNNSADANRLLDKLEFLQDLELSPDVLLGVVPHRISRLRRQGERYFADSLRDISRDRRLAILAVCTVEWKAAIADAVVETHDRIVGKTWREAKKLCDAKIDDAKISVHQVLRSFTDLGSVLLEARNDEASLEDAVSSSPGWSKLEELVTMAAQLTNTMLADPLTHVVKGYHRFRRYAPRMLRVLKIESAPVAVPLIKAANLIRNNQYTQNRPTNFLRRASKWHRYLKSQVDGDGRIWEVSVLFCLRDAFRSGDIWLQNSRRYADLKQILVPVHAISTNSKLSVPLLPEAWLDNRRARMEISLKRLAKAAQTGSIPNGTIDNGVLQIERLANSSLPGVDEGPV